MADYYPLIFRAVDGLEHNTGENRRALYERARAALLNQLRGVEPPLEEADITRERLALEDAIRKVEVEAAKRPPPEPEPQSAAEQGEAEPLPSLRDRGLSDFRRSVSEVVDLGEAASEANRSAREVYETMPGEHPPLAPSAKTEPEVPAATHYFEPPAEPWEPGAHASPPEEAEHGSKEHAAAEHAPAEHEPADREVAEPPPAGPHEAPFEEYVEPAATMPPSPVV